MRKTLFSFYGQSTARTRFRYPKPASAGRCEATRGFGGCAPVGKGAARLPPTIKKPRVSLDTRGSKVAATYSPTWCSSTIGASELNFSVRNGKRWILTAITTAVFYLREISEVPGLKERFRAISTGRLNTSLCVHLLPINVVVSHDPIRKSHLGDGFALRCFQRLS